MAEAREAGDVATIEESMAVMNLQNGGVAGAGAAAMAGVPPGAANPIASASLYVGDLHPDVTEANLFEVFSAVGPVTSIRVCRDMVTRRSLGYAYVNFNSVVDAERALDTMNFFASPATKDKPLRLMWKHRDPNVRRSGQGNVFVKNLDKSIDNKTLYDTFSSFGNIMSCKVMTDEHGESRGYGFVHFETAEAADAAIAEVDKKDIAGKPVSVTHFKSRKEREATGESRSVFTNVFIKNLPESHANEAKLREMFGVYGEITSVFVPTVGKQAEEDDSEYSTEQQGGSTVGSKGFAFVNFESPEAAAKAVDEMDNKEVEDKVLYVGRAQKKSQRETELRAKYEQAKMERIQKYQGVNLFVKNLSDDVTEDRLRQEFMPYGTITSCKVMLDDKGASRGFGFVCFSQPDEATKAVTELNGRILGQKPIYVALAQRKDVRRAQLEAQMAIGLSVPGMVPGGPMFGQPGAGMFYPQAGIPPELQGAAAAAAAGRQGPGAAGSPFLNQQYLAAMSRGGPGGPQMMMRGGMMPSGAPVMYGMQPVPGANRNVRQNRQRGGMQGGGQPGMGGGPAGPGHPMYANQGMRVNQAVANGRGRPAGNQPQFKYTATARNAAGPGMVPGAVPMYNEQVSQQAMVQDMGLTLEMLANAPPQQQKTILGERLYPQVFEKNQEFAGKITGMLLEMDNSEILHLLESPEALDEKVSEALDALMQHSASS
ncbi:Embryonic polyadenylate-binding protein [Porphyridium purpureum]|uniref:Polyadenylate-binding protein n=1 Tax=Porphyridium purpureum TaxID=35688 RepID=A0A5J4Z069_PORPP|nr:Embryonic polyadenylate-binding protein [Porphyridium purpureum]|eukprot:POR0756..scf209_3